MVTLSLISRGVGTLGSWETQEVHKRHNMFRGAMVGWQDALNRMWFAPLRLPIPLDSEI